MAKLRYGIIGTGAMGQHHMRCIDLVQEVELVAGADTSPGSRLSALEFRGAVPFYDNHCDLLESESLDAVIVATPNDTHADIVCDALAAGVHVLAEKPVASTLEGCNRIVDAAKCSGRVLQIGLELRHAPIHIRMRELIEEGRIGVVRQLWCKEFRGPWMFKVENWITQQSRSGGTFMEKNCHHFDLFNWYADARPVRVAGFGCCDLVYGEEHFGIRPDVLDNAQAIIQFEGGAVATQMDCMYCTGLATLELGVIGTEGWMVSSTGGKGRLQIFRRGEEREELEEFDVPGDIRDSGHDGSVYFEHVAFADAICNGSRPVVDVEAGWWSTVVGLAAERAVKERRVVELGEFVRSQPAM